MDEWGIAREVDNCECRGEGESSEDASNDEERFESKCTNVTDEAARE